jgi:hypothetical protein
MRYQGRPKKGTEQFRKYLALGMALDEAKYASRLESMRNYMRRRYWKARAA